MKRILGFGFIECESKIRHAVGTWLDGRFALRGRRRIVTCDIVFSAAWRLRELTDRVIAAQAWGMVDVVCGVIVDAGGRYLACLRPEGRHLGGLWEFPGGKVEPGELPAAALARELQEELGVRVEVGEALRPVIWHCPRGAIRLLPYRCRITGGEPQALEHERLFWFAPEEFSTLDWAQADVPILDELRRAAVIRNKIS
jgi:8-oxo-dGTP diphosphatase